MHRVRQARLHVSKLLGLELGDAHIIRNAGGIVTGKAPVSPARFYTFTDLEENVCQQMRKVRTPPWVPETVPVRGFVYDVDTGRLSEVSA